MISRLTSTGQTRIARPVRTALGLRAGDALAYVIEGERVVLTRVDGGPGVYDPFAGFSEWGSNADAEAYGGL